MKKKFFIASAFVLAMGLGVVVGTRPQEAKKAEATGVVGPGDVVYLLPNNDWKSDNARFAIYTWSGTNSNQTWTNMTAVSDTNYYQATIPATAEKLIFGRMNPATEENNFNDGVKWNQSYDLVLSESTGDAYEITGWSTGTWSTYVAPTPKDPASETPVRFYVYDAAHALGDADGVHVYGFGQASNIEAMVWPGTQNGVTRIGKNNSPFYQVDLSESYPNFIMNGNSKQTVNVTDLASHVGDVAILGEAITEGVDAGKYPITWEEYADFTLDVPDEDGYYLVGAGDVWTYAAATKLDAGDEQNHAKKIRISLTKDDELKVRSYFEGVETWHNAHETGGNYVVHNTGFANVYVSKTDNEVYFEEDVPASDGYYLEGDSLNWDWSHKMTDTEEAGNVAKYVNVHLLANDEIRVASYFLTSSPNHKVWATLGTGDTDYGKPSTEHDGNYLITKEGYYDVWAKIESEVLKYYVSEHADLYTITMKAVKFNGAIKDAIIDQDSQTASSVADFVPVQPALDGYVSRGYYTDENCTTPYSATRYDADGGPLYAKYTKIGYYLTGDQWFMGGAAKAWNPDYATLLSGDVNNKLVGSITIPQMKGDDPVDADHTVEVKPIKYSNTYNPDGSWEAESYSLGTAGTAQDPHPTFVTINGDGNFEFNKPGVYAFYVNDSNQVWFNDGEYAWYEEFLSVTGNLCHMSGGYNSDLETEWATLKASYLLLDAGVRDNLHDNFNINSGDKDDSDARLRMIARYSYIVQKYGTLKFEDFIWGGTYSAKPRIGFGPFIGFGSTPEEANNNMLILIVALSTAAALSFGAIVFFKKRKKSK